jgi:hypothetical protein
MQNKFFFSYQQLSGGESSPLTAQQRKHANKLIVLVSASIPQLLYTLTMQGSKIHSWVF